MLRWLVLGLTSGERLVSLRYETLSKLLRTNKSIGGFCVTYFQTQWVAKSGAAVTFGVQGAIIAASFIFVIITQVMGRSWRTKFLPPAAEI